MLCRHVDHVAMMLSAQAASTMSPTMVMCSGTFLNHNHIIVSISQKQDRIEVFFTKNGQAPRYDFKVDLWALGCLLYLLTALEPPFQGRTSRDEQLLSVRDHDTTIFTSIVDCIVNIAARPGHLQMTRRKSLRKVTI